MKIRRPFNRKRFFRLAGVALLATLIFVYVGLSVYSATTYLNVPNRSLGTTTPADLGLPYEDVAFQSTASDHLTMRGWWIPSSGATKTIIFFHGQNGNRTNQLALAKPLHENNFNLLLVDLRGHGLSDGDHHTLGVLEQWDAVGAVNFLKSRGIPPASIGVIGWSIGAAIAMLAMGDTPDIKAGVSDSGYTNLGALFGLLYPGMWVSDNLIRGIDLEKARPDAAVQKLGNRHLYVIHGDKDGNVPVSEAAELKKAGGANVAEVWIVPGAGHTAAFSQQPEEYVRRVAAFFKQELA